MKKHLLLLGIFMSCLSILYAQPGLARRNIEWHPKTPPNDGTVIPYTGFTYNSNQTQTQSAEDWWYDVKAVGGATPGYIACGFTRFLNMANTEQSLTPKGFMPGLAGSPTTAVTTDEKNTIMCNQRLVGSQKISNYVSTVAFYNLLGELQWTKTVYTGGALNSIMPTSDGGFIAIGDCRAAYKADLTPYVYNPTTADMNNVLTKINTIGTAPATDVKYYYQDRICVVKLSATGDVQWSYLYGYQDLNGTNTVNSTNLHNQGIFGIDIDVNPSGGYTLLGLGSWGGSGNYASVAFKIDANGMLLAKQAYQASTFTPSASPAVGSLDNGDWSWCKALDCDGGNCVITGGLYATAPTPAAGFLLKFDQNTLALSGMTNNPSFYLPAGTTSNILEDVIYNSTSGTVVCAALRNNTGGYASGDNYGEGGIAKFNASTGAHTATTTFGEVRAYDLRMGITELQAGGYAVVSSKRASVVNLGGAPYPAIRANFTSQQTSGWDCTGDWTYSSAYWNTDTYVHKFNSSLASVWSKQFDSDGLAPVNHPGDFKKQECMYHIAEGSDRGLFVVGNSSHNVDDYFSAKLFSDCQNYATYTYPSGYTVLAGSTTWSSGTKTIKGLLTIPSGATLTISGSSTVVEFADTRRVGTRTGIVIQPGGKLILSSGATLTSFQGCPGEKAMWDGIEVQGNYASNQIPNTNQGVFEIQPGTGSLGGNVVDARTGATTTAKLADGSTDWSHTGGGIMKINKGHFLNNGRAFEFRAFTNPSGANESSYIVNSTFDVTSNYGDGSSTNGGLSAQITMNAVKNVQILGNSFNDQRPITAALPLDKHTTGIYAIDASFELKTYCTSGMAPCPAANQVRNSFSNLAHGVYVSGGASNAIVKVDQANFTNNMIGVRIEGAHYGYVQRCLFDVPKLVQTLSTPMGVGVYYSSAYGINIDENTFNSAGAGVAGSQSMGVYINNSDDMYGGLLHYRNTFNNLTIGTQAANQNNSLQLECNWFNKSTNGKVDIHVPVGAIANQGSCWPSIDPAANKFTGTCNNTTLLQISSAIPSWTYYSYPSLGLSTSCVTNSPISNAVGVSTCGTYVEANACPTHFPGDGLSGLVRRSETDAVLLATEIQVKENQLPSDAVISEAISNLPAEAALNTILAGSPYISAQHLKAVIDGGAPVEVKRTILLANIPLPQEVIDYAGTSSLPETVVNEITVGGQSPAEDLANYIAALKVEKQLLDNEIVLDFLDKNELQKARQYLADQKTIPTLMQLISISMHEPANVLNALFAQLREERSKLTSSDAKMISNIDQFLHYYTWRAEHLNADHISLSDYEAMASYYKENDVYSDLGNGILYYITGNILTKPVYELDYKGAAAVIDEEIAEEVSYPDDLTVYPNPTSGALSVETANADEKITGVTIYGFDGRVLHEISNISESKYQFEIPFVYNGLVLIEIHTKVGETNNVSFRKVMIKK